MRRSLLLAVLVPAALTSCIFRPRAERVRVPRSWRYARVDSPVVALHAMVASEHPIASDVGAEVMRRGGNAIDAAVAVGFAEAVVNPRAGNIGGGGFLVYRRADGEVFALDYRETAPAAASRDMYLDSTGQVTENSLIGPLAAGVPGSVAGLWEMHHRFGHLPWRELLAPAIRLAGEGHVVDSARAAVISQNTHRLSRFPTTAALLMPGGEPLPAGTLWRQPDLERTLRLIADSGADAFYRGRIADLIVAEMRRTHGLITHADLEAYRALWREPVRISYRGWTIFTMPPSSGGGVTLAEMLNVLEGWPRLPDFGTPGLVHVEVEAMRRAFTDRNRWLGDPAFVQMPLERLLSKPYAATLRAGIDRRATATAELPPIVEGTQTTHYSIVDAEGNAVAITTTLNDNFGDALVVGGAGFLLNDEMDDFAAKPGTPNSYGLVQGEANAIAPGKRMLSAMTPCVVLDSAGRLALVLGSPGGPRIITGVLQVISNVIDHGMSLSQAVYAPRIHHQALPDSIRWEPGGLEPGTRRALERLGHHFFTRPAGNAVVEAVRVTPRGLEGVTDPRIPSRAAGF
jgi:gamma-glutamyltranspeptidase/glutathione hydrolase